MEGGREVSNRKTADFNVVCGFVRYTTWYSVRCEGFIWPNGNMQLRRLMSSYSKDSITHGTNNMTRPIKLWDLSTLINVLSSKWSKKRAQLAFATLLRKSEEMNTATKKFKLEAIWGGALLFDCCKYLWAARVVFFYSANWKQSSERTMLLLHVQALQFFDFFLSNFSFVDFIVKKQQQQQALLPNRKRKKS